MDDESVEKMLNAVDERTALQKQLHTLVCDGFMWLSRERYRDSLATHRLAQVASDERDVVSKVFVRVDIDDKDEGDTTATPVVHMERTYATEVGGFADTEEKRKRSQTLTTESDDGMRRRRATRNSTLVEEEELKTSNVRKRLEVKKMDTVLTGIVGMPSSEIREAAKCFTQAIDQALALVSATSRVDSLLHNAIPPGPDSAPNI